MDKFGEGFHMKLDKDKDTVNSIMGSCLSIFMTIAVTLYFMQKSEVWLSGKANLIFMSTQ